MSLWQMPFLALMSSFSTSEEEKVFRRTVPSPVSKDEGRVGVGLGFKFFLLFSMS